RHVSLPVIGSDVHHVDKGTPMKAAPPSRNRFLVRREAAREAVRRYILADAEVLPNTSGKVRLGKVPQHLLVEHLGSGGIAQGALYLREGVVGPLRDGLVGVLVDDEPIPGRRGVRAVHGQEKHVAELVAREGAHGAHLRLAEGVARNIRIVDLRQRIGDDLRIHVLRALRHGIIRPRSGRTAAGLGFGPEAIGDLMTMSATHDDVVPILLCANGVTMKQESRLAGLPRQVASATRSDQARLLEALLGLSLRDEALLRRELFGAPAPYFQNALGERFIVETPELEE